MNITIWPPNYLLPKHCQSGFAVSTLTLTKLLNQFEKTLALDEYHRKGCDTPKKFLVKKRVGYPSHVFNPIEVSYFSPVSYEKRLKLNFSTRNDFSGTNFETNH